MKAFLAVILFIGLFSGGLRTISLINEYADTAAAAYQRGEYIESVAAYEYLLNDLEVQDDQLRLNLGHSYFKIGELQKARQQYTLLASHSSRHIRAVALLQLGNIAARDKKYKQALSHFRHALIVEPGNSAARYNYELLKKYLAQRPELANEEEEDMRFPDEQPQDQADSPEQRPQPAQDDLTPQPKKKPDSAGDQEEEIETPEPSAEGQQELPASGSSGKEQDEAGKPQQNERPEQSGQQDGDTKGFRPDSNFDPARPERSRSNEAASEAEQRAQTRNNRLRQLNITPDKARLMLEAMRNAEQQYIQQLPKKATRKPDGTKPDW